jgi:hypothetical protein
MHLLLFGLRAKYTLINSGDVRCRCKRVCKYGRHGSHRRYRAAREYAAAFRWNCDQVFHSVATPTVAMESIDREREASEVAQWLACPSPNVDWLKPLRAIWALL